MIVLLLCHIHKNILCSTVKWDMMLYNVVEIFYFWGMCCSWWCEDGGQHVHLKHQETFARLHDVTSQTTCLLLWVCHMWDICCTIFVVCTVVMWHSEELVHSSDLATISFLCICVYCCIESHLYCGCCRHHNRDWMCSRIFWNRIRISCTLHVLPRHCSRTGSSWSSTTYCQIRQVIL